MAEWLARQQHPAGCSRDLLALTPTGKGSSPQSQGENQTYLGVRFQVSLQGDESTWALWLLSPKGAQRSSWGGDTSPAGRPRHGWNPPKEQTQPCHAPSWHLPIQKQGFFFEHNHPCVVTTQTFPSQQCPLAAQPASHLCLWLT